MKQSTLQTSRITQKILLMAVSKIKVISFLFLVSTANIASASNGISFCSTTNSDCIEGNVMNAATVVVKKVIIKQRVKEGNVKDCPGGDLDRTYNSNMLDGDKFEFLHHNGCYYNVKFVTTDGCIGDKEVKYKAYSRSGRVYPDAVLKNYCGKLKAEKADLYATQE